MAERGPNTADKRLVRTIAKGVGSSMRHLRGNGLVVSKDGPEQRFVWKIAD